MPGIKKTSLVQGKNFSWYLY